MCGVVWKSFRQTKLKKVAKIWRLIDVKTYSIHKHTECESLGFVRFFGFALAYPKRWPITRESYFRNSKFVGICRILDIISSWWLVTLCVSLPLRCSPLWFCTCQVCRLPITQSVFFCHFTPRGSLTMDAILPDLRTTKKYLLVSDNPRFWYRILGKRHCYGLVIIKYLSLDLVWSVLNGKISRWETLETFHLFLRTQRPLGTSKHWLPRRRQISLVPLLFSFNNSLLRFYLAVIGPVQPLPSNFPLLPWTVDLIYVVPTLAAIFNPGKVLDFSRLLLLFWSTYDCIAVVFEKKNQYLYRATEYDCG